MTLLDKNILDYVVKSSANFLRRTIHLEDKNGVLLGKIKKGWTDNGKNSLFDLDGTLVLTYQKGFSFKSVHDPYEIKNDSGRLIGKVIREGILRARDIRVENVNGDEIIKSKIPFSDNPYDVYDNKDKVIANVKRTFHSLEKEETYEFWTLHINDLSFDRVLLLGFYLSMLHPEFN